MYIYLCGSMMKIYQQLNIVEEIFRIVYILNILFGISMKFQQNSLKFCIVQILLLCCVCYFFFFFYLLLPHLSPIFVCAIYSTITHIYNWRF